MLNENLFCAWNALTMLSPSRLGQYYLYRWLRSDECTYKRQTVLSSVHLLSASYTTSRCSSNSPPSPEALSSSLDSSPDSSGRIGVSDFLNVSFTSAGSDDAVLAGKVSVITSVGPSGWENSSVMSFPGVEPLWVSIGVTDACDVAVVTGWVFSCSWTVISGTEVEEDDVTVETEVDDPRPPAPAVMTSLTDWLLSEPPSTFG